MKTNNPPGSTLILLQCQRVTGPQWKCVKRLSFAGSGTVTSRRQYSEADMLCGVTCRTLRHWLTIGSDSCFLPGFSTSKYGFTSAVFHISHDDIKVDC